MCISALTACLIQRFADSNDVKCKQLQSLLSVFYDTCVKSVQLTLYFLLSLVCIWSTLIWIKYNFQWDFIARFYNVSGLRKHATFVLLYTNISKHLIASMNEWTHVRHIFRSSQNVNHSMLFDTRQLLLKCSRAKYRRQRMAFLSCQKYDCIKTLTCGIETITQQRWSRLSRSNSTDFSSSFDSNEGTSIVYLFVTVSSHIKIQSI